MGSWPSCHGMDPLLFPQQPCRLGRKGRSRQGTPIPVSSHSEHQPGSGGFLGGAAGASPISLLLCPHRDAEPEPMGRWQLLLGGLGSFLPPLPSKPPTPGPPSWGLLGPLQLRPPVRSSSGLKDQGHQPHLPSTYRWQCLDRTHPRPSHAAQRL